MTPEETKRTIDFILENHANFLVRMDRLEVSQKQHDENLSRLEASQKQHDENLSRLEANQKQQKEAVDVLVKVTQDLLKVSTSVVDRIKRLESQSDSVEEMTRVLRELLEASLRRPDNPGRDRN